MCKRDREKSVLSLEACERAAILYAHGMIALEEGYVHRAIGLFRRSVRWNPHYQTYERLYTSYMQAGMKEEALRSIREAYERCPCNDRAAYCYAILLKRHGEEEEARAIARDIMARNPRYYAREINKLL